MVDSGPDQLPPAMKWCLASGAFVVGYGLGICPTCILSAASVVIGALLCLVAWDKYGRWSVPRLVAGGFFAGSLLRIAAIVLCMILVDHTFVASNFLLRVHTSRPLAAICLGATPAQIWYRNEERLKLAAEGPGVRTHLGRTKPDPFSGQPFLSANGKLYSVGPDMVDNGLATTYDPTNGTVSGGDIAVRGAGGK